jgi:hypothetical protein
MNTQLKLEHASDSFNILEAAPKTLPSRVNQEMLKAHDKKPLFLDLRIGRVGAVSQNTTMSGKPRRYERQAWDNVVTAINSGSIVGLMGHPQLYGDTGFNQPVSAYWLEASIKPNGDVFGTAYIAPGPIRDHVRVAKALGMGIATSLSGIGVEAEDGEIRDLELQQLDFVLRPGLSDALNRAGEYQFHTETVNGKTIITIPSDQRQFIEALFGTGGNMQQNLNEINQIESRLKVIEAELEIESASISYHEGFVAGESEKHRQLIEESHKLKDKLQALRPTKTEFGREVPYDDDENPFKAITY